MQVKIGDAIYDSDLEPIMLILSQKDKRFISDMAENSFRYCSFPMSSRIQDISVFMEDVTPL